MNLSFSDLSFREEWTSFMDLLKFQHVDLIKPIKRIIYIDILLIINFTMMVFYIPSLYFINRIEVQIFEIYAYLLFLIAPLIMFLFEPYTTASSLLGPWHFKDKTNKLIWGTNNIRFGLIVKIISVLGLIILFVNIE